MIRTLKILLAVLIFVIMCGCAKEKMPAKNDSTSVKNSSPIEGKWKSKSVEKAGEGAFVERRFRFLEKLWQLDYTLYQDEELKKPVFQFQGEGSYEIEGLSSKVDGALNGNFKISKKYLTLLTDDKDAIKTYGFDIYKFVKGQKMDISETGCYFIPPVSECDVEYDIVKVEGNELYFGKRPDDNNISKPEQRPTELGLPLVRQ